MEIVVFCVTDYIDKCEMNAVSFFIDCKKRTCKNYYFHEHYIVKSTL